MHCRNLGCILHKFRLYIRELQAVQYTSLDCTSHKFRLFISHVQDAHYTILGYTLHSSRMYITKAQAINYINSSCTLHRIRLYSHSGPGQPSRYSDWPTADSWFGSLQRKGNFLFSESPDRLDGPSRLPLKQSYPSAPRLTALLPHCTDVHWHQTL